MSDKKINIYFGATLSGSVANEQEIFPMYNEIQRIIRLIEMRSMVNLLPQLKGNKNLAELRAWMKKHVLADSETDIKSAIAEYDYTKLEIAHAAIFEATYGGFGVGQEFGYLHSKGVPILFLLRHGAKNVSFMPHILYSSKFTSGRPSFIKEYSSYSVLERIVVNFLNSIKNQQASK